jgi:hypothetical protein
VAFYYAVPISEGFPLGPVAFVCEAAFSHVVPFLAVWFLLPPEWDLCPGHSFVPFSERPDLSWLQLSRNCSYLLDICHRLQFVAVGTLFSAWLP